MRPGSARAAGKDIVVFVGTYTEPDYRGKGEGIYSFRMSLETGALEALRTTPGVANPSYIALDTEGSHLYCVNELRECRGEAGGAVSAFSVDPETRALTMLNTRASGGAAPCHIVIGGDGLHALVSNYSGGSLCVLPIARDGSLGGALQIIRHEGSSVDRDRQLGPHVHSLCLDPAGRYAFACDLGLDRLVAYRYDARSRAPLSPADGLGMAVRPGSGPRHCAFHPSGRYCYLINELDATIEALRYRPGEGSFEARQRVPASPEFGGLAGFGAAIRVSPDGRFLYSSNRGPDSIGLHRIDPAAGTLAYAGCTPSGGRGPRDFAIDPSGSFLLAVNQGSDSLVSFGIDAESGRLEAVAQIEVPTPVCVAVSA